MEKGKRIMKGAEKISTDNVGFKRSFSRRPHGEKNLGKIPARDFPFKAC